MSYQVKQNLFLILPTEAKSGDPQLGRKQTVRGPSAGHEEPPRSRQTPRTCLAQIWQEHESSGQCPLGEAAAQQCTGFLTFNFSQIPPTPWGMHTPSWEQGLLPGTANESPSRPTGISVVTPPCQKLLGRECSGWVLSSSSVSRDSEKVCQVYTTQQAKSNLKWLEPRSEIGKYLRGDQFLFTQTKPNFQPPQNENWQQDVLICMHKTHILLIQS